jgi:hypothetical protein
MMKNICSIIEFQLGHLQKIPGRAPETWGGVYENRRASGVLITAFPWRFCR